jgi:stringent starvation protein B
MSVSDPPEMTSSRPYLIRAFYDWIVDNGLTPHLLVDATAPGVVVPEGHAQDGRIILNVSPTAVRGLELGTELIGFHARFSGADMAVRLPPRAVLAVYARENGRGMLFPEGDEQGSASGGDKEPEPTGPSGGGRPSLKVVK